MLEGAERLNGLFVVNRQRVFIHRMKYTDSRRTLANHNRWYKFKYKAVI
jgi:hypothetical protein